MSFTLTIYFRPEIERERHVHFDVIEANVSEGVLRVTKVNGEIYSYPMDVVLFTSAVSAE